MPIGGRISWTSVSKPAGPYPKFASAFGHEDRDVTKAPAKTPPQELSSIVDFIRYGVTRFAEGKVAFGQGTDDPVEEAIFLVCEALGLPIDRVDSFLPARMTTAERRKVFALIEKRV